MSFTFIKQRDVMQCGIACLAMICRYWGAKVSMNILDTLCTPTKEGVSMLALSNVADSLCIENATTKLSICKLYKTPLPAILHWRQNHFVVLYKISKDGKYFYVADPGKGKIKYSLKDFTHFWICNNYGSEEKGIAMFFKPTHEFYRKIRFINKKESLSWNFIFRHLKWHKKHFSLILLGLLLGCILQLIMPFLTQSIVDIGIKNKDIGFIWLILLGEMFIVVGRAATDFIRRRLLLHISMRINISLVSDFFIKLLKLPMSFFDTKLLGDLMQRMGDHSRVQSFLTTQVLNIIFSVLSFIIFGIVLLFYDYLIFGVFILCSMCYGGWIALFLKKRKVLDYELFEQQAINQNKTYQFFTNMQEIKLQDCEQRRRWEWEDVQADLFSIKLNSLKLQQTQEAGSIFINEMKNIIITILSATAVINGQITLGAMLAIQYIIGQLNSPIEQIMSFIYSLQDVKISLERINEIHKGKNEETETNQISDFSDNEKDIVLDRICFKYDPHALKETIKGVSISIPAGKVTAIVGASGSGKTTLIKLMLGYYHTFKGSITIAGKDINQYNLKWWRQHCGVVMQDGVIFSESIARNIAVSDGDINFERLETAARIANIHEFIISLPLKYNTIIGHDGIGLSQGQKQRILIARAVYKNPDYIFLDEATNALDAENERAIVENLTRFYNGRTVIVVAHRLSTVKNADQIVVIDKGMIIESGTHTSLIEQRGAYFKLIKNQLELGN